ncbi:hypothetical protein AG1IA_06367 [Rhizoctonia solani AG-1 IA]|uniref:Uncharacterized protein n=1 Tax=Thanatephorus cucumeris (strain AG1-IA) TaxID=983506 RepID=L8WS87_THACA|nr:hypothetical protein AG1IA_06367 [Rhizoctonia solani AG-1 IA]
MSHTNLNGQVIRGTIVYYAKLNYNNTATKEIDVCHGRITFASRCSGCQIGVDVEASTRESGSFFGPKLVSNSAVLLNSDNRLIVLRVQLAVHYDPALRSYGPKFYGGSILQSKRLKMGVAVIDNAYQARIIAQSNCLAEYI